MSIPRENLKLLSEIEKRYYFGIIKRKLEEKVIEVGKIKALDYLTEIMKSATTEVELVIQKRIADGIISDAAQARKSIAGNGFQGLAAYCLIHLQEDGKIPPEVAITLKPKRHPLIEKYATIKVGNDTQKPDIDLLVYHYKNPDKYPVLIYSIKTSLRERAGQTYRWKLLMDIATSRDCESIKSKYNLKYESTGKFMVGFITTNFYEEIMNPQQQGMLRFFDFVYITKVGNWENPVKNFSNIIDDLNNIYGGDINAPQI